MEPMAAVAALVVLVLLVVAVFALFMKFSKGAKEENESPAARTQPEVAAAPVRRGGGMDRMRRGGLRNRRAAPQPAPESDSGSEAGSDDDSDDEDAGTSTGRLTKREARRQAQREAREAERAAREAKANRTSAYEERRAQKEREREERERQQEEERRRAAEERQRKDDEEAAQWMNMISLEQQGEEQAEAEQAEQGLLESFVGYIIERKMVPLEEIAVEFKLRTTDVIDRIQGLEAMGRLSGVMDERGKYIYISKEEMQAVAEFVRGRGRVAIAELAAKSSGLIDLDAKVAAAATSVPMLDFDAVLGPEAVAA